MTISLQRLNWRLALCTLLLAAGLWHMETHTEMVLRTRPESAGMRPRPPGWLPLTAPVRP